MTRRDQFANAAMAAILSQRPQPIEYESSMSHLAFLAYRMADAMEREARVQEAKHDND